MDVVSPRGVDKEEWAGAGWGGGYQDLLGTWNVERRNWDQTCFLPSVACRLSATAGIPLVGISIHTATLSWKAEPECFEMKRVPRNF